MGNNLISIWQVSVPKFEPVNFKHTGRFLSRRPWHLHAVTHNCHRMTSVTLRGYSDFLVWNNKQKYSRAPVSTDSVSDVYRGQKKNGKLKKLTVHKFQNARQAITGCNMVKSSSPNAPSTWLIFLCPRTHPKTSESLTFICTRKSTL
jgi:hypothetical protein